MATIGQKFLDLSDLYKGKDGSGQLAQIINMLAQSNAMLPDMVTRECNSGVDHKHTIMSGLPSVVWGQLYKGVPNSKSQRTQVKDVTGYVEGLSTVDSRLAEIEPDLGAFRLQEAQGFIEALSQEMQRAILYESSDTAPEKITGLAPRYSSLSAENGSQIIDAGGTGSDNTSVWFVTWGADATHCIYPKGSTGGLIREDHDQQRVLDGDGNPYYALEETFRWHNGLSVRDWRKNARVANIDVSDLQAGTVDIYKFLRKAYYKLHGKRTVDNGTAVPGGGMDGNFEPGNTVMYCNSDVFEAMDAAGTNAGASDNFVRLRPMEIQGQEVMTYRGMPVRQVDQLLNTEARVV